MPPKKRKASESVEKKEDGSPPARKLTKKEVREQAMQRARLSMQQDKQKVIAAKAKKSKVDVDVGVDVETDSDVDVGTPQVKRRKVVEEQQPQPPASSKKKAREDAIQRAKEWGAQEKEGLQKKKPTTTTPLSKNKTTPLKNKKTESHADVAAGSRQEEGLTSAPPIPMEATTTESSQQPPSSAPMAFNGPMNPAMMAQYMMSQQGIMPYNPYMMQQQPYGGGFGGQFAAAYGVPYVGPNMPPHQQQQPPPPAPHAQHPHHQPPQTPMSIAQAAPKPSSKKDAAAAAAAAPATTSHVLPRHQAPPRVAAPPATAIPDDDDDDDDDDDEDMPPPPVSKLEMQISQQVMANCVAASNNQPTPYNAPPPEAFQGQQGDDDEDEEEELYDEQPIIVDDDEEAELYEVPPTNRKKAIWARGLLTAIVVGVVSYFLMMEDGSSSSLESPSFQPETVNLVDNPPCFIDSVTVYDDEYGEILPSCHQDGAPCPTGGVCEDGVLVDCNSKHHQVSENKAGCILAKHTNETLSSLKELLEEWSEMEQQCSETRPMFAYSKLQLARPLELATNPLLVNILDTAFITERREDGLYIGLLEDLELPLWCRMGLTSKTVLANCGSLLLVVFHHLLSLAWACFSAYPLASLIGLVVVLIVKRARTYQAYRSKLVRDIAQVRQMAYDLLQDTSSESHVVLHIRDEITMTLYPNSKSQRHYLIQDVWPRVVPDLAADNRVRKSTKVLEGKPRDVWQWVAASSAKKKQKQATIAIQ